MGYRFENTGNQFELGVGAWQIVECLNVLQRTVLGDAGDKLCLLPISFLWIYDIVITQYVKITEIKG